MKNKLTAEITRIHYAVPLDEQQWHSLNAIDKRGDDRWDEVFSKLTKAGASHLEYNGHFGRNIFFSIETKTRLTTVLKAIERIVKRTKPLPPTVTAVALLEKMKE